MGQKSVFFDTFLLVSGFLQIVLIYYGCRWQINAFLLENYDFHDISKRLTACNKQRINIYYTPNIFTYTSRKNLYAYVTLSGKTVIEKDVLVNT